MSRRLRIIVCSILVLFAFGAGIFAYAHTQLGQNDAAVAEEGLPNYLVDKNGKIRVPAEPATADARDNRGTADNPFFVLEIVPYEGMASFGYHISGCEPIDVDAAARDKLDIPGGSTYYTIENNVTYRFWPEEKPITFTASSTTETIMNQYGTMTYVKDGSGQYNIVGGVEEGIDKTKAVYQPVAEGTKGYFVWKPLSAEECYAMKTNAEAKAPYEAEFKGALTDGISFKMFFKDVTYVQGTGNKVTHKHTFLKESVGLKYAFDADGVRYELPEAEVAEKIKNYKSVVYTVTPEDLNMNPELVDRADLIVIATKTNFLPSTGDCPNGWYTYLQPGDSSYYDSDNKVLTKYKYTPYLKKYLFGYEEPTGQYGRKENNPNATFNTNLLDWSIVVKIAGRAMDDTHILPVIMENKIFQNTYTDAGSLVKDKVKMTLKYADGCIEPGREDKGTQENMAKLYIMLCQMKTSTFKALYGNPADASNALFSSQDLVLSEGNKVQMKNGAYMKTGVFNYDNGRSDAEKGTEDSRAYWNDKTLIPWHLLPTIGYSGPDKYAPAVAMFGIGTWSDGYSMTSGDSQNSLRNGLMGFDDNGKMWTGFDSMDCGVKNGIFGAQLYQYFDTINGSDPMPAEGDLTTADCLFYLLNGVNGGPVPTLDTTQYKILELQPSSDYEPDDFWKMFILAHTNSVVEPEVKKMTTSEFIGSHVECISEYDLTYVGMRKAPSEPTMKFPSETTDYVYAHTGPKVTVGTGFRAIYGWLRSDKVSGLTNDEYDEREQYFAYSGNDLTNLAYEKLEKYDEAGFPIVFSNGFYSEYPKVTDVTKAYKTADTIDRNSNIYKLGDKIDDAGSKVFHFGELNGDYPARAGQLVQTLTSNSKKVQMVFSESPVLYNSKESDIKKQYINGYDDTYRTLKYKFYLKAPAGTAYEVKLYVDVNTDGYYATDTEDMGVNVCDTLGNSVYGMLEAGKEYIVERPITNRIGSLPWKLDLVKDGKVYASESGVSAIKKGPGDTAITIKVLQILPKSSVVSLSLPVNQADANAIGGASKTFFDKIQTLDCFDISFTRMTQEEIKTIINGGPGVAAQPDYLYQNYDMLVLGFGDMYDGVSEEFLLDKIQNFINRGKAVLYTHDTSSTIGRWGSDFSVWGSNVTMAYRDMFGMDRYGAKEYFDSDTGDLSAIPMEKDKPYEPSSGSTGQKYENDDGIPLIQGLSNGLLFRATNEHIKAYEVSKVNTGAITQYPFTIPDSIPVAATHPQYYQLDMEQDEVVVWYCLNGGTPGKSSTNETTFFGKNKNDVRNNYYIYNIGNVTYSGMGHMDVNTPNALALEDLEIELFINTFVAAYRAPAQGVPVKVTNDDVTSNSVGEQFLCVDVDSAAATEIIGIDIVDEYRLMEVNGSGYNEVDPPVKKKSKRVYFYLDDNNAYGADTVYKLSMKLNGSDTLLAVHRKLDGQFIDTVTRKYEKDVIYYVDVPITIDTLGANPVVGKTELEVTVKMTYYIGEEPHQAEERTTKISILPRGLYDLH